MKFHQLFTLFIVLVFLIFPPIFINNTDMVDFSSNNFNRFSLFTIVISSIWSVFLYFFSQKDEKNFSRTSLRISLLSFILIFYISWIFQQVNDFYNIMPTQKIFMSKTDKLLNCLQIVVLCIYEEILYRKFLYSQFESIFSTLLTKKCNFKKEVYQLISIFVVAILFGLAHLYSGILNVIFAFISSLIFSMVYKKTKNIIFTIIPHVLYNILIFLSLTKI